MVRRTNEFRYYFTPGTREFNLNDVFFNLFNARGRKMFRLRLPQTGTICMLVSAAILAIVFLVRNLSWRG